MRSISLNNVCFSYNKNVKIFENFSWQFNVESGKGRVTAIMGPSGAGKSTLLKLLLGLIKPQSGNISLLPRDAVISYVPQEPILFEHLSVKDNARYFSFAGAYKKNFNEGLYNELAKSLEIEDVIERARSVTELSGGQRQRLSLLRALSVNPDFLLLDEPCNGLDAEVKRAFLNKLRQVTIQREQHALNNIREVHANKALAVLYVTHHKLEAQLIADDVLYLSPNRQTGYISNPTQASIQQFLIAPPVLEAANVFRFPDVKILPIKQNGNAQEISKWQYASKFLLLKDNNLEISLNGNGWQFRILSLSPVFGVVKHEETETEWMVSSSLLKGYNVLDSVTISISGEYFAYDKEGVLIQN